MNDPAKLFKQLNNEDPEKRIKAKKEIKEFVQYLSKVSSSRYSILRDETTHKKAEQHLAEVNKHFPFTSLYKALEQAYDDDMNDHILQVTDLPTRLYLLEILWYITDRQTIDTIARVYHTLPNNHCIQFSALRVLSNINTAASLGLLVTLLVQDNSVGDQSYALPIFMPLWDATQNIKALFPEILQTLDNEELRKALLPLFCSARRYGHLTKTDFQSNDLQIAKVGLMKDLIKENRRRLKLNKKGRPYRDSTEMVATIIEFLGSFQEEPEVVASLTKFLEDSDSTVVMNTVIALVSQGIVVDRKAIYFVAADPLTRIRFFEELEPLSKTSLFPDDFYAQEYFAESIMVNWLSSGMEMNASPDKMQLVSTRELIDSNERVRVFLYKFWYDSRQSWAVGQSGPQPIDQSKGVYRPLSDVQ